MSSQQADRKTPSVQPSSTSQVFACEPAVSLLALGADKGCGRSQPFLGPSLMFEAGFFCSSQGSPCA